MLDVRTPALVAAFLLAACNFPEPPLPEGACRSDAHCTSAGKGVCDLAPPSGDPVCVQCTPGSSGDASACAGVTPACGDDRTCRKCQAHSECASDACLPTGACATEAEVIYLRENGTGNCAKDTPCGMWIAAMAALSPTRKIIRASGNLTVTGDVNNKTFAILGDSTTTFRSEIGQDTFAVRGAMASNIEIYDSKIQGSAKRAVDVDSMASIVKLIRCKITGSAEEGLSVRKGKVEVSESEVSGGSRRGVFVEDLGDLKMTRSFVASNAQGGIVVVATGKLNLTSSFIVKNQGAEGAIRIPSPGPGSDISFNTIVDNVDAGAGSVDTGGIFCDDSSFTFRNNIIYRNRGGVGDQQTAGICMFDGSYLQAAAVSDTRLNFKGADDYHLTASSPAMVKDVAGVACAGLVDYDGEARPQGAACDLGADELKQ